MLGNVTDVAGIFTMAEVSEIAFPNISLKVLTMETKTRSRYQELYVVLEQFPRIPSCHMCYDLSSVFCQSFFQIGVEWNIH